MTEPTEDLMARLKESLRRDADGRPAGFDPPKASTVNRVRTPSDDVVDAWWADNVTAMTPVFSDGPGYFACNLSALAQQPEAVQRGVLRKARGL